MKYLEFKSINTNNLKNISIQIPINAITCITGCSGSGKSTLAFDSIYAICKNKFQSLLDKNYDEYEYSIGEYGELLVPVAIKQLNFNNNPKSTIATYYGLDIYFKKIFSIYHSLEPNIFSFNNRNSVCKRCNGIGYEYEANKNYIIDNDSKISELVFKPFRDTDKDFYKKIIEYVCEDYNIPLHMKFNDLEEHHKEFLLYGTSEKLYKVKYVKCGKSRVKTSKYVGIIPFINNHEDKATKYKKYCSKVKCKACGGTRFDNKILKYKVYDYSIADLYDMNLDNLLNWFESNEFSFLKDVNILTSISEFLKNMISLNLSYVSLNRSISSLSGGEFQRLRISKLLNTEFKNLLIVIDEPTSSLYISEKYDIIFKLNSLKNTNTVLIVEHDLEIIKMCDKIITLGNTGGKNGGYIVNNKLDVSYENKILKKSYQAERKVRINNDVVINNLKPFSIDIPMNTLIGICGKSGSGKTTFVKEILPNYFEKYRYISQKPIKGNIYSNVGSYVGLLSKIRAIFAKENGVDESYFSNHPISKGHCKECGGTGVIEFKHYNHKFSYTCTKCNGKKYSEQSLKYKYKGFNIYDILSLECNELTNIFEDKGLLERLEIMKKLGLGYMSLGQDISTLSGGESQRVKLIKHITTMKKNEIIALDEPFQGLGLEDIYTIIEYLYSMIDSGNTIIIVEHNLKALELCSHIVEFGSNSIHGEGNIIFDGPISEIKKDKLSEIKKYLNI